MTATETYEAHRCKIDVKIARLQELLRTFDRRQAADPKNWAFAGSVGHISAELSELIAHITGEKI